MKLKPSLMLLACSSACSCAVRTVMLARQRRAMRSRSSTGLTPGLAAMASISLSSPAQPGQPLRLGQRDDGGAGAGQRLEVPELGDPHQRAAARGGPSPDSSTVSPSLKPSSCAVLLSSATSPGRLGGRPST